MRLALLFASCLAAGWLIGIVVHPFALALVLSIIVGGVLGWAFA